MDQPTTAMRDRFADQAGFVEDVGEFRWRDVAPEDWVSLLILWGVAIVVFVQFFTRYVLNDSQAWTEEIAIYLLMVLAFVGSAIGVRRNSHIHIEFFYQFMPRWMSRAMATVVDLIRTAMFGLLTVLGWRVTELVRFQHMIYWENTSLSWVFGACTAGCAVLTIRSAQLAWRHWRGAPNALVTGEPNALT